MSEPLAETIETIKDEYTGQILQAEPVNEFEVLLVVEPDEVVQTCSFIVEQGWWHLSTITGKDTGEEIQCLYHFYGEASDIGVTVRTGVDRDEPVMPSITPEVPAATMYEREIMDLFGVVFEGHPNPERLVLADDWPEDNHPLRLEEVQKRAEEEKIDG